MLDIIDSITDTEADAVTKLLRIVDRKQKDVDAQRKQLRAKKQKLDEAEYVIRDFARRLNARTQQLKRYTGTKLRDFDDEVKFSDACAEENKKYYDDSDVVSRRTSGVYIDIVLTSGKVVQEHRYIVEQLLGRKLASWEQIHHRDGYTHNNHPHNLELWTYSHPKGQRVRDVVKWCREQLELYEGGGFDLDAEWDGG